MATPRPVFARDATAPFAVQPPFRHHHWLQLQVLPARLGPAIRIRDSGSSQGMDPTAQCLIPLAQLLPFEPDKAAVRPLRQLPPAPHLARARSPLADGLPPRALTLGIYVLCFIASLPWDEQPGRVFD